MPSTATMNTIPEGLLKVAKDLTGLMAFPGTEQDLAFLTDLQTRVLGYIQHANTPTGAGNFPPPGAMPPTSPGPAQQTPEGMPPELAAPMGGGAQVSGIPPASGPPGGMPMPGGPPPMPGGGPNLAGGMPNPDELRRLMSAG